MAAVTLLRNLRLPARRCTHSLRSASALTFDLKSNIFEFDDQTVFAGTDSLQDLSQRLQSLDKRKPLFVSDDGITATNCLNIVRIIPFAPDSIERFLSCDVNEIAFALKRNIAATLRSHLPYMFPPF